MLDELSGQYVAVNNVCMYVCMYVCAYVPG